MRILTVLIISLFLINCNQGWSIGEIQLTPSDTLTNTVFIEIADADSIVHWFHGTISDNNNWCYKHQRIEEVIIK